MGWGFCTHNSTHNMRDKHYKVKHIRMDDKTFAELKKRKLKFGKSWNLFLLELLKKQN